MKNEETIAAISTPLGEGGIGIVRISGKDAFSIAKKIFSPKEKLKSFECRKLYLGKIFDPDTKEKVDEVLISLMKSPHTYTREDIVEINSHSGILVLKKILEIVLNQGARLAEAGEFTKRAFLSGRIDLSQAEAVIDIVKAKTEESLKLSTNQLEGKLSSKIKSIKEKILNLLSNIEVIFDYPEEGIEEIKTKEIKKELKKIIGDVEKILSFADYGKILRDGVNTVIVGKPNVGKSSLFNALLEEERAIVTSIPGTTRDFIEESINIQGIPFNIKDTAGLRETKNIIEIKGVEITKKSIDLADLILFIIDSSRKIDKYDKEIMGKIKDKKVLVIYNKIDLKQKANFREILKTFSKKNIIKTSLTKKIGLNELKKSMAKIFLPENFSSKNILLSNLRQKNALSKARNFLEQALHSLNEKFPNDIICIDLRESLKCLAELTGENISEEILTNIFSKFCVGK